VVLGVTAPPVTVRGVQLNRGEAMTAVLGLAVGAFVGVAFDEHTVRPPAHTDGLWILLVVVVSARHTMVRGILRGAGALLLGVLAFFAGRRIGYHMLVPAPGFRPGCMRWTGRSGAWSGSSPACSWA
jgi:hypothetical protein